MEGRACVTGVWLVSYLALWALVIALGLLLLGLLRQVGLLQLQLNGQSPAPDVVVPAPENNGPPIGSHLPELGADTLNGFGPVAIPSQDGRRGTLLAFMSPLCESCQNIVEPLNALAEDGTRGVRPIVIMRAEEQACRAFNSVFPLRVPLVCDADRTITMGFGVHGTPSVLLYDAQGTLLTKGIVTGQEQLAALVGELPRAEQVHTSSPAVVA